MVVVQKREHRVTAGGSALEAHIRSLGISIPDWCDAHGLSHQRVQIQRLINGQRYKRVGVDLAFALEDASGGAVPARLFRSGTARMVRVRARAA